MYLVGSFTSLLLHIQRHLTIVTCKVRSPFSWLGKVLGALLITLLVAVGSVLSLLRTYITIKPGQHGCY